MQSPSQARKILRFLGRPWSIFVEVVSTIAALLVFFEVYIQTIPAIDFSDPSSVGPFVVKNESNFFDMTDNSFSCGIDFVSYETGNGKWIGFGGAIFGPTESLRGFLDVAGLLIIDAAHPTTCTKMFGATFAWGCKVPVRPQRRLSRHPLCAFG
jgi:hypothetical protein